MIRIAVDFDNNAWVCLHANPDDAPNLFGVTAPNLGTGLPYRKAAGSYTEADWYIGPVDEDRYGKVGSRLTSFGSGDIHAIGCTAGPISHTITNAPAGDYSASLWIKNLSTVEAATVRLTLYSYTHGAGISSAAVTVGTSWQRLTVSGNLPYANMRLELRLEGVSGSFFNDLVVTGPMVVSGLTLPDWLNAGADSLLENITSEALAARWTTGFVRPYQYVAPVGRATIHLNNQDKRFTPEYASGPHFGAFGRDKLLRIADDSYAVLWTGFVERWQPQYGEHTARRATLIAVDGRKYWDVPEVGIKVQVSKNPEQIVRHLINRVKKTSNYRTVEYLSGDPGTPGNWEVDWLGFETEVAPYYCDNATENVTAAQVLADLLLGIQAKAWISRFGFLAWGGPSAAGATSIVFDNTAKSLDYEWGEPVVNECEVSYYQRATSAGVNSELWKRDTTFDVAAGATETLRCFFRDDDNDDVRVSAVPGTVAIGTFTASGGNITASIVDEDATSCTVNIVSTAGGVRTVNELIITGKRLTAYNKESRVREDATSISDNGRRVERIDSKWTPTRDWAKQLAGFRIARLKDPRGEVRSIVIRYRDDPATAALCEVGRVIQVLDNHLEHNALYVVIGEDHDWKPGVNHHQVRLYLEPRHHTTVSLTPRS